MSDNPILLPIISEMLNEMSTVCSKFNIDFYLVGAIARDIHLSVNEELLSKRRTKDIDLAITISDEGQYNEVKATLIGTGLFEDHESEPIKLIYKKGIEVDLLPFGQIEQPNRNVKLSNPTFILNMPGFIEIYPFVKDFEVGEGQKVKVCTMEGIILLKLIAHDDRPQRTKDIADIEHIIQSYFALNDDDIYMVYYDIMELYDTDNNDYIQLVCARLIGRKINILLGDSPELAERVRGILSKRETPRWQAMLDGMKD
jgi:predicted nucleotidyltransferase